MSDLYEAELSKLAAFIQPLHPIGAVKAIGLLEAVEAAVEVINTMRFRLHLRDASQEVASWPEWKQKVLGGVVERDMLVSLDWWLSGREPKNVTIIRKNGRIGKATRLDMPLFCVLSHEPIWTPCGSTCVFLNDSRYVHGQCDSRKAWAMVVVEAKRKRIARSK